MANLLTPEQKKYNKREQTLRLVIVGLGFACGAIILGGIFLVPSYILAESKKAALEEQVNLITEFVERRKVSTAQTEGHITRTELEILQDTFGKGNVLDALSMVLGTKDSTVFVTSISYVRNTENGHSVQIEGIARGRETLLAFKKRLEREAGITNVELPVANLIENTNPTFSISFQLTDADIE